jgi:hydrogenase/urease accessory protein HupE
VTTGISRLLAVLALWLSFAGALGQAHESRPLYVEITENDSGVFMVKWRTPASVPSFNIPEVTLSACEAKGPVSTRRSEGGSVSQRLYDCYEGLGGKAVDIKYPLLNPSMTTLVRMETGSGRTHTKLLSPRETQWTAPETETRLGVAREYSSLGIRHILEGVDHLLFVLGLMLIVSDRWMLLKTITSFTVAHSITLAIATLGYASVPLEPLNVAVALSILFLGPEIVRHRRGETSLTIQHPWMVAFAFGLLHGFGFASGLSSIGLPSGELPIALLFFNVGVEIGQVGCVALVLLLERSFRTLEVQWPRWAQAAPGYAVGTLGAFWTIERTLMMFGGRV